jgi:hypothetical protein
LRSGEIRALHREQVSIPSSGLVIDRALDDRGEIGLLKKATNEDPRSRAVIIPEIRLLPKTTATHNFEIMLY